jgi:uncharacterized membrane protein
MNKNMALFTILCVINSIAALVVLYFFIIGLADGTVSHQNIMLWLFILFPVGAVLFGSILLQQQGYHKSAIALSLVLAIPAIVYGLFVLLAIFSKGKWN